MLTIFFWTLNSLTLDVLEGAQVSLSLETLELERRYGSTQSYGVA
jgi:hypothetical protein